MMKSSTALLFLTLLTASLLHQLTANKCPVGIIQNDNFAGVYEDCSAKCVLAQFSGLFYFFCDNGGKTCTKDVLVGDCKCHFGEFTIGKDEKKVKAAGCCFDASNEEGKQYLNKVASSFDAESKALNKEGDSAFNKYNKDRDRCKGATSLGASLLLHIAAAWLLYAASF